MKEPVVDAICREINGRHAAGLPAELDTLYFGGGTPSILERNDWEMILKAVHSKYRFKEGFEFTVECNPEDLNDETLEFFKKIGINRLSIGVQSFDDANLKLLNRNHTVGEVFRAVAKAQEKGFKNITIDLIYGIPGMSLKDWEENVRKAISLNVRHISAYSLTIEPKTLLDHQQKKGLVKIPNDAEYTDQFMMLIDMLNNAGFEHYELSNFARPGFRSAHNSSYWHNEPYMGFGPSSHSFDGKNNRSWNISNNAVYVKMVNENGNAVSGTEELSFEDLVNEHLMTRLRLIEGIDKKEFETRFSFEFNQKYEPLIRKFIAAGWMLENENNAWLTNEGKFVSDHIISELFLANEKED